MGPAPGRFEGVPAGAAAQIEDAVTGAEPEPVVANGQHASAPPRAYRPARSVSSVR